MKVYVLENGVEDGHIHGSYMVDEFMDGAPPGATAGLIIIGSPPLNHGGWVNPEKYVSSLTAAIDYAASQGALGVTRSYASTWTNYSVWEYARSLGLWVWTAHHSNDQNVYSAVPPRLYWSVSVGGEDPLTPLLERTRGPGLEIDTFTIGPFVARDTQESPATVAICALMLRALHSGEAQNLFDARALMRQAASHYQWGHDPDTNGYGYIPWDITLLGPVELQPPLDIRVDRVLDKIRIRWINFETTNWVRTVVIGPDGGVVYSGTGEEVLIPDTGDPADSISFNLFSEDEDENRSNEDGTHTVTLVAPDYPPYEGGYEAPGVKRVNGHQAQIIFSPSPDALYYQIERLDGSIFVATSSPAVDVQAVLRRSGRYRVRTVRTASAVSAGKALQTEWSKYGYLSAADSPLRFPPTFGGSFLAE